MKKIAVIGGGAAGISAAIEAALLGARVTVFEHMEEPLKKLLLTGNGRCNFSNDDVSEEHYHGCSEIIRSVCEKVTCDDILDFMADTLGVEALSVHYRFGGEGYFYPSTNRAETVRNAMLDKCRKLNVKIVTGCTVSEVRPNGSQIDIFLQGCEIPYGFSGLIFACGSNSHPETGSDSSIYGVLKSLSVPFKTFRPALTSVKSKDAVLKELRGIRADGEALLINETTGETFASPFGEIQFNEHSVSGIPVMQLSRYAGLSEDPFLLKLKISKVNNKKDVKYPFEICLKVSGTGGFKECQCCTGGVPGEAVDPETLMYRKIPGICFAGEMLDVDGDCGGYNLHFAIASGLIAARSVIK